MIISIETGKAIDKTKNPLMIKTLSKLRIDGTLSAWKKASVERKTLANIVNNG